VVATFDVMYERFKPVKHEFFLLLKELLINDKPIEFEYASNNFV